VFTGLIEDLGSVRELQLHEDGGVRIRVETRLAGELGEGDSIAVNGVCLTATQVDGEGFAADVMNETLRRSSLGRIEEGARVNLELPLRPSDRLGGHVVQGHVDGEAVVVSVREDGMARVLDFGQTGLMRYLVEKGSVALDGVSLTVSELGEDRFSVSLIPETLQRTRLGELGIGDTVNVEVDVLAKHVERLLGSRLGEPAREGVT
jgi:riboflavin synthase